MQRRIKPYTLSENAYGTSYPAPPERMLDMAPLSGGLNLWELDYRLDKSQSPDLINMYWKDGSLSSRPGQEYVYDPFAQENASDNYGQFYACYERPWHGYIIAHKGDTLYRIDPSTGEHTKIYQGVLENPIGQGHFFVFGSKLYYMNGHSYLVIDSGPTATDVKGYIPVVLVNTPPTGRGGTQYQPENRISAGKTVQYTQEAGNSIFNIPDGYWPLDEGSDVIVKANSLNYYEVQEASSVPSASEGQRSVVYKVSDKYYKWDGSAFSEDPDFDTGFAFTVNRNTGTVTFNTPPVQTTTQVPSNVSITFYKTNEDAESSVLNCTCVTVFGGDTNLAVVCGGPSAQPNAYFWSGNTSSGLDPTYFPMDNYNYAGSDANEYITGFGKQQSMLVIFKEHSIGKSYFSTEQISGRDYLKLSYLPVNDTVGCDRGGSIRLVQNNLVFANTYGGVYVLLDTTAAGENTVTRISRNINGDGTSSADEEEAYLRLWEPDVTDIERHAEWEEILIQRHHCKGLLYDLRQVSANAVTSYDDNQRYWLCVNGHVYLWDYTLSSFRNNEGKLSWFYFENVPVRGWFKTDSEGLYLTATGALVRFFKQFSDFGEPIQRKYTFATQNFGTYEVLKDVLKVVFAVRSDTDSEMDVTYYTDYERRKDLTPIRAWSWKLVPRDSERITPQPEPYNLEHRSLLPIPFAGTAVRKPRCFHVRHFSMILTNNTINTDMSIISAQIIYRYMKEDR